MVKHKNVSETRSVTRLSRRGLGLIVRASPSRKIVITIVGAGLAGAAATVAFGGGTVTNQWLWFKGDTQTYIGSPKGLGYGPNSLLVQVAGDLDMGASHIRFGSTDGNYEFEHSSQSQFTRLNSYFIGTPKRTPIVVGGNDGQDVLSLLVQGKSGQRNDLQQWESGSSVKTAINGNGDLRLGNVVLLTKIVKGHVELIAQLRDGSTQVLAFGSPDN
jgi:hypothetical protein